MGPALQRMLEEEPTVRLERTATGEQVLRHDGRGPHRGHHRAAQAQVRRGDRDPHAKVPYKETIRGKTQVHGRYKKQTGGHGMFGDVWIELEPNPDGGVEFAERVVGGSVPKGFFAGVEKGIREAAAEGVVAGYPLSDFKATLYDGSFHPVDSNELSFKIAASMALKDGVHQAKPALMEPIMTVEIRVPEAYMGEVNRDLNGRRGRVLGMDSDGTTQIITRPRPRGRAVHLRDRAALTHPRSRHVLGRRSTTTRTCPRTSPRRSSPSTARSSRRPAARERPLDLSAPAPRHAAIAPRGRALPS